MPVQKVSLSLDSVIYNRFKDFKKTEGLSISSWVSSKMLEKIQEKGLLTEKDIYKLIGCLNQAELEEISKTLT